MTTQTEDPRRLYSRSTMRDAMVDSWVAWSMASSRWALESVSESLSVGVPLSMSDCTVVGVVLLLVNGWAEGAMYSFVGIVRVLLEFEFEFEFRPDGSDGTAGLGTDSVAFMPGC